jgi:alpha-L-fucosidase 2
VRRTERLGLCAVLCATAVLAGRGPAADPVARYDVVWDSPSKDSLGSMPLGNGETGLNVWVEQNGDLLFYMARPDAFAGDHRNLKLGRIRVHFTPNPLASGRRFRQKLELENGRIVIDAGGLHVALWVDANRPVARLEGRSDRPVEATIAYEMWRKLATVRSLDDGAAGSGDVLLDDGADRILWYHRNGDSVWRRRLADEGLAELVAGKVADPLLGQTFGGMIAAPGFRRSGTATLATAGPVTSFSAAVHFRAGQYGDARRWASALETQAAGSDRVALATAWREHQQWWWRFWRRSWIRIERPGITRTISERYAHQRFISACGNRGRYPVLYNGSIFTMDLPAGTPTFFGLLKEPVNADYRSWDDLPFMWQNTRHPYWPMLASGDYDLMRPVFTLCRDSLAVCKARARVWYGHDGMVMPEAMDLAGVSVFARKIPQHLAYHRTGMIEMATMMCDYFAHTGDRTFARETLLPFAEAVITFLDQQYPGRDARGRMVMGPTAAVETYQPAVNVVTESAGLALLLDRLMAMPPEVAGAARRAHWSGLRRIVPGVPVRTVAGQELLAVADETAAGREIVEVPELYAVWPFRQATHWRDGSLLAAARQSFAVRMTSLDGTDDKQAFETGGWLYTAADAAYLGLAGEAARLVAENFGDNAPWISGRGVRPPLGPGHAGQPRFAAFWETRMDFIPDQCHGGASIHALQSMLLQSDGKRIYLLPAWPVDWDVSFKLHAPMNTTVAGEYRGGRVRWMKTTPEWRRGDVIDMSSPRERIRTLVGTVIADRNYLFGLPPMADGESAANEAAKWPGVAAWVAKYGHTLRGLAGPWRPEAWGGAVANGDRVFLHILRHPGGPVRLPAVGRRIVRSTVLTAGKAMLESQGEGGAVLDVQPAPEEPDTIVELKLDGNAEELARAVGHAGSLTHGSGVKAGSNPEGAEVDLGRPRDIGRAEVRFEARGKRPLTLEWKDERGEWRTVWRGNSYSTIWSRRLEPVRARYLRVVTAGPAHLDLFGTETGR